MRSSIKKQQTAATIRHTPAVLSVGSWYSLDNTWASGAQVSGSNPDEPVMELFVYGTLKDGDVLAKVHASPAFIIEGWVEGRLYSAGRFPIFLPSRDGRVRGRVLAIDTGRLTLIDEYESGRAHPPLFLRRMLEVHTDEGKKECWAYVGNLEHPLVKRVCICENVIPDGLW